VTVRTVCLALVLAVLVWSGIGPADRFTWWLEVAPVLIGLAVVLPTRHRFPLTSLLLVLLTVHAAILCVGGHWTYAEVPFGFWMARTFGFARNHYDRIGHFAQGFVPAIVAREVLIRRSPLAGSRWLPFVVVAVCLAASAFYELVEWWTAILTEGGATAFLGTQGDVWDTQWDMCLALAGASTALVLLSGAHDRALARMRGAT
jgi:putative membrane protein